jgi:hypothetical protein
MLVQGRTDGVSPSDALTYEVQLDYWIEFSAPVPTYASWDLLKIFRKSWSGFKTYLGFSFTFWTIGVSQIKALGKQIIDPERVTSLY